MDQVLFEPLGGETKRRTLREGTPTIYDRTKDRSSPGCGIIFYFILKMKNAMRGPGNAEKWKERDERAFSAQQFRSRGEIDRDDVQIILF